MDIKKFRVAGIPFAVCVENPWKFMSYTAPVQERIELASSGEALPVVPTRAGDKVPARTFVQRKEELPENRGRNDLDFSQYEPFADSGNEQPTFSLTVHSVAAGWIEEGIEDGSIKEILKIEDNPPFYYIYKYGGKTIFRLEDEAGGISGTLCMSEDFREGDYFPAKALTGYAEMFHINMALMIMYTYNSALQDTLLVHASVVRHKGKANVFLGMSGTGKSTHSHLWLHHVEGAELVNDDNPALKMIGNELYVFGTPWSGKTPCYRNISVPVRAIVRLKQAGVNRISPIEGLQAYASLIASASSIRWERQVMDGITRTAERAVSGTKCYHLDCLPDKDAALTCMAGIGEM